MTIRRSHNRAAWFRTLDTSRASPTWFGLPSPLKGFTDALPEIKAMLRVCAFHLYGWACEHASVAEQAAKVRSGWIPDGYPKSWPRPGQRDVLPLGLAPFTARVEREIAKRKQKIKADLRNASFINYPNNEVLDVLKFWNIELE